MSEKLKQPKMEWGFYAMTPRIVRTQYKDLTHAEKWFYTCLKDLCGDDGMCFRTLRKLQEETDISLGSLTPMINHLNEAGLIHAEKKKRPKSTREVWHITIVDIWQANFKQCSKNEHSQEEDSQCSKNEQSIGGNVQKMNEGAKELSSECSNFATRRRYTKNTGTIEEDKDTYTDLPSEIGTPSPSPLSLLLESWRTGSQEEQQATLQVLIDAGIIPPANDNDNHSHSSETLETSSQSQNSTTIPEPSQSAQISPSTSLPGFEPPTSNPKQQTPKNALEVAKLAMPTNEQVWSAETLVQTLEFHRGRAYPNGAKRKSDRVRDVELEAAKTLISDASDIWSGHTTEQNAATLIRIVANLETKWWLDTNGNILPHQLVDKDRIHTAHKRIQTATLMTTSSTTPIDFTAQKEAARIKNLANIEKMNRIKAKLDEERKQQAGKKRVAQ